MGMVEIDPAFIQDLEHRPKLTIIKAEGIPIIDLSVLISPNLKNDPLALDGLAKEIGNACKNWGFFQVINHGVPQEIRQQIENASRKFFGQPLEEKKKVERGVKRVFGYYDSDTTDNVRDWKEMFDFAVHDPIEAPASHQPDDKELTEWFNQWPKYPPELREVCEEYAKEVEKLAYQLMELIALSLGLSKDRFHGFFKDQTSFISFLRYPRCPSANLALGVGHHTDGIALTILAQDEVGGLEVKRKPDGEWLSVEPAPNAYIINVGDVIQVWSNDAYESVEHRVTVNTKRDRFSIPFFFGPAHYTTVQPLEEMTNEQNPGKYKPFNFGKFHVLRTHSIFQKLDVDYIKISHFKTPESELEENLEGALFIK